jgi:hypothetical protein
MRTRLLRPLMSAALVATLSACVSTPREPAPEPLELPVKDEPASIPARYSDLPTATMAVRWTTNDLKEQLKNEFTTLALDRSSLVLVDEGLVSSAGVIYRRVWFSYGDGTTVNMHGTCGQNIYLWFNQQGERVGTYVDEMNCPI